MITYIYLGLGLVAMVYVHHKANKAGSKYAWIPMVFVGLVWLTVGYLVGAIK